MGSLGTIEHTNVCLTIPKKKKEKKKDSTDLEAFVDSL